MINSMTPNRYFGEMSRRKMLLTGSAAILAAGFGGPAQAITLVEASALITRVVNDLSRIVNENMSRSQRISAFEILFERYANVASISRSALGPSARMATSNQMTALATAFPGYMARKYGSRFDQFIGGTVEVTRTHQVQSYFEVVSEARVPGSSPFEVRWHVSDSGGRDTFFNLIVEGVNVLSAERQEIGAMLERRHGNIDQLIVDLRTAG
jgi:phospholipid transport system substrate-binding protein